MMVMRGGVWARGVVALLAGSLGMACGGGGSNGDGEGCSGDCARQALAVSDVEELVARAVGAAQQVGAAATIAVVDRVGNVLAVYAMRGTAASSLINAQIGASGGLEGAEVSATLAAISKAGTGAYLSSQGNAFSTRTASQIVQEHFLPGRALTPSGPLFGVQFSQLPCGDLLTFESGSAPRPLPLGLSADPGGLPLYRNGDVVGGIGVELDGAYRLDRNPFDRDADPEEIVAMSAAAPYAAPEGRRAERISAGGQTLRFSDVAYELVDPVEVDLGAEGAFVPVAGFFSGQARGGALFGSPASGVIEELRRGVPAGVLVNPDGSRRIPTQRGASRGGLELSAEEVDAILDSALLTAQRLRAAIRRPLDDAARVSVFVVDHTGRPIGFTRSQDAPVFGIDVALQKARTAAFFSSDDAARRLDGFAERSGGTDYMVKLRGVVVNQDILADGRAFSCRAVGNLARPFLPDGVDDAPPGPFSLPFPTTVRDGQTWSPFTTGLQLDLVAAKLGAVLGGASANNCTDRDIFGERIANGIQIFPGAVPLYRGANLIGAIGVSGDGVDQDDAVAFLGAGRRGLDAAGHVTIGDPVLGFNAAPELRSDRVELQREGTSLRYINCPEGPLRGSDAQNLCDD